MRRNPSWPSWRRDPRRSLRGTRFRPGPGHPICATCHAAAHDSIAQTHHGAKNDAQGGMCQACHGDASAHLKDPANKPENKVKKGHGRGETAVCMTCHAGNRQLTFWESGKHSRNDVTCSNCHNIHKEKALHVAPYTTTSRPIEADTCGTATSRFATPRSSPRTTRSSRAR
jgi:hypothetical protein